MRPVLTRVDFGPTNGAEGTAGSQLPLLVLGPSLGTTVTSLWQRTAAELSSRFRVVGWQLPGHGGGTPAGDVTIAELAAAVLDLVDTLPGHEAESFYYAGDSVGGAVGLQLLLDAPHRVVGAALLCTGARIGDPDGWTQRAATVRAQGTAAVAQASPGRWFAPGFADREPQTVAAMVRELLDTDAESYAAVCDALAVFDVRDRLAEITVPVLAIAGDADIATPVASLRHIAGGVRHGRLAVIDDAAHLPPVEAPRRVAELVATLLQGSQDSADGTDETTLAAVRAAGMRVRRQVLGDEHVDRAGAATTAFTEEFQRFITSYAWGSIWTRPGLDRRSRSLITLTALVARGHHDELAMHVRAALRNGVTEAELAELFLQTAIYCGVPDANTAFRIAAAVLTEVRNGPASDAGSTGSTGTDGEAAQR